MLVLLAISCSGPADDDGPVDTEGEPTGGTTGDTGEGEPPTAIVTVSENPEVVQERRFQIALSREATVELRCTSPDEPLEDHRLPFTGSDGEVRLWGVLADTAYTCVLTWGSQDIELWQGDFVVGSLPIGLPQFVVTGDASRAHIDDGYLLMNHWAVGQKYDKAHRLLVVDGDGRIRWMHEPGGQSGGMTATWYADDGVMVAGGGDTVRPSLRTLSGEILYQVPEANAPLPLGYHHEALRSTEGWVVSLQGTAQSLGKWVWQDFLIEAWDPVTDTLQWQFDSTPWVAAGMLERGGPDVDPAHTNAVQFVDDDVLGPSVWISMRGEKALGRIDRATGDLTHVIGPGRGLTLVDLAGAPLPNTEWFFGQHDPHVSGDRVLMFDNGSTGDDPKRSRALLVRMLWPDTVQIEWEWTEPGWYEPNYGAVQWLPDGHVLIGSGHCNHCTGTGGEDANSWVLEVDPATDEVLWRLDFDGWWHSMYRAEHIAGCDIFANARLCPELAR